MTDDREAFTARAEPLRRELLAHCYRMLGSPDEAEDAVQETYLRAWRAYPRFEERASMRVWLYRIATNASLDALDNRARRPLPSGLGAPADDPHAPPGPADLDVPWLRPIPDALVTPESADPAVVAAARASLRLALVAGLQYLPPRQRAVLILREVLGFPAAEVAEMLGLSVAGVKSLLQRARARLDEVAPSEDDADLAEPASAAEHLLLEQYIAAFERSDIEILERALRADASLELLPSRTWFAGKATCVPYLRTVLGAPGDWRLTPTRRNGQPAASVSYRGVPFGVAVLTITTTGIRRIVAFGFPELATPP
ncbi:RNA polymerase subunit sigma-70 [Dactylosporangium sp. NPDC049140]|uniref:RNA polymerase subunit sigma-70 n=1 Tax=Dactylosporangium sp. NPDC049140 TaxID=3155647 RepID=UPI0033DB4B64